MNLGLVESRSGSVLAWLQICKGQSSIVVFPDCRLEVGSTILRDAESLRNTLDKIAEQKHVAHTSGQSIVFRHHRAQGDTVL